MPKKVILIAAVTVDGFIARHKNEITTWSKDLHFFKKQTMGYPLIMGSNTFKTIKRDLVGREMIIINRNQKPESILSGLNEEICYIIGGGKTFSRFTKFYTHIYITPHPYIFGKGIRLFSDMINEISIQFLNIIEIDKKMGIYQYQYEVSK